MTKNFTKIQLKEKKEFFNKNGFVIFENVLNKNDDILNFEITKNCFINLELNIENFIVYFQNIENNIKVDQSEKIIFDYCGPNIGKPLHVGHLRSLNIG